MPRQAPVNRACAAAVLVIVLQALACDRYPRTNPVDPGAITEPARPQDGSVERPQDGSVEPRPEPVTCSFERWLIEPGRGREALRMAVASDERAGMAVWSPITAGGLRAVAFGRFGLTGAPFTVDTEGRHPTAVAALPGGGWLICYRRAEALVCRHSTAAGSTGDAVVVVPETSTSHIAVAGNDSTVVVVREEGSRNDTIHVDSLSVSLELQRSSTLTAGEFYDAQSVSLARTDLGFTLVWGSVSGRHPEGYFLDGLGTPVAPLPALPTGDGASSDEIVPDLAAVAGSAALVWKAPYQQLLHLCVLEESEPATCVAVTGLDADSDLVLLPAGSGITLTDSRFRVATFVTEDLRPHEIVETEVGWSGPRIMTGASLGDRSAIVTAEGPGWSMWLTIQQCSPF